MKIKFPLFMKLCVAAVRYKLVKMGENNKYLT